jgi:Mn-dependent DtxR family transcriptional regulator
MSSELSIPLWNEVLVELSRTNEKDRYCERLNRRMKASRSHMAAIVKRLQENGLIAAIAAKKIKKLVLTEKGTKVARSLQEAQWHLKTP